MSTHDPMCPFFYDHTGQELVRQTGNGCVYCQLIARVREDERKFGVAPEDAAGWGEGYAYHCGKDNGFLAGYAAALRDAVESVVNCDDYHSGANMLLVDAYREGLQAAREAIDALRQEHK